MNHRVSDGDLDFDQELESVRAQCSHLANILKSMYGPRSSDVMIVRTSAFQSRNVPTHPNMNSSQDSTLPHHTSTYPPNVSLSQNSSREGHAMHNPGSIIYSDSIHGQGTEASDSRLQPPFQIPNQGQGIQQGQGAQEEYFYRKNPTDPYVDGQELRKNIQVTNDGATAIRLLTRKRKNVNPVHLFLSEVSESQERIYGDGTTSVVLFTSFLLDELCRMFKEVRNKAGIVRAIKSIATLAVNHASLQCNHMKWIQNDHLRQEMMKKWIETALKSKILRNDSEWTATNLVLPIISYFESRDSGTQNIGKNQEHSLSNFYIDPQKRFRKGNITFVPIISSGSIRQSTWINGIVFKRGLVFAGHKNQLSKVSRPKILLTSDEIEWKQLKESVRLVYDPSNYENMIQLEWQQCKLKLDNVLASGTTLVFSSKSIGDYATQFFSRHGILCIGNISSQVLEVLSKNLNIPVITSLQELQPWTNSQSEENNSPKDQEQMNLENIDTDFENNILGTCEFYQEIQLNGVWYCKLEGIRNSSVITFFLHAPSKEIYLESRRSLEDVFGVAECLQNNPKITFGGGAYELYMSAILNSWIDSGKCNKIEKASEFSHLEIVSCQALSRSLMRLVETLCANSGHPIQETCFQLATAYKNNIAFQSQNCQLESLFQDVLNPTAKDFLLGVSPGEEQIASMQHVIEPLAMKEGFITRGVQAAITLFLCKHLIQTNAVGREERAFERYSNYREQVKRHKQ